MSEQTVIETALRLATDEQLRSEVGRRSQARRKVKSGGKAGIGRLAGERGDWIRARAGVLAYRDDIKQGEAMRQAARDWTAWQNSL